MDNYYVFIIDTDSYSGNFEVELCAYLTGIEDESRCVNKYVELFKQEMNIEEPYEYNEHILFMPGKYGETPCSIWSTPEWILNNADPQHLHQSVAIFMDRKPTNEEIEILKERANKFQLLEDYYETPKVLGFRLIQTKTTEVEIQI